MNAIDDFLARSPAPLISELVDLRKRREVIVDKASLLESILRLRAIPIPADPHPPRNLRTARRKVRR